MARRRRPAGQTRSDLAVPKSGSNVNPMVPPDDAASGHAPSPLSHDEPAAPALVSPPSPVARPAWWASPTFLDLPGAAPATKADGGSWLGLTAGGFLVGQITGYLLAVVVAAVVHGNVTKVATLSAPPEWYVVSSLVGIWIGFAAGPLAASRWAGTRRFVADLGVRFRWIDLVGVVVGVVSQGVIALLYLPFRSQLHNYNAPVTKLTGSAHGSGFALIAVLTVVGAPFFEELFFRGLLFKALARLCTPRDGHRGRSRAAGVVVAVVLDGALFGLAHVELEQLAGLALFGMVLAVVSYRTNRLGMNMVAHGAFNLVTVLSLVHSNGVAW